MNEHVKRIGVSIPFWLEMCVTGWNVGKDAYIECVEGLPAGAKYVRGWVDEQAQIVWLVVEHPSFESVLWGETIPELWPVLRKTFHEVKP